MTRTSSSHRSSEVPHGRGTARRYRVVRKAVPEAERAAGGAPTAKAFGLLEALVRAERPMSLPELALLLAMPKPTIHRVARLLEAEQLLQREPGSRLYRPGARLLVFSLDVLATSIRSAPRHAILETLSAEVGETCNFGVIVDSHVVYIDRVEAAWPFGLRFQPGSRVPLHCTAMGKMLLAMLRRSQRASLLEALALPAYTERTITDPAVLEEELEAIRKEEISIDNQEFLAGVVCLAVPVRDGQGTTRGAIAVSAPLARMTVDDARQHIPALRKAAARLGATLYSVENGAGRQPR